MRIVGENHYIDLFMWEWQPVFRKSLNRLAATVFGQLAAELTPPNAFLVGVLRPGEKSDNPVCIEPDDGPWTLGLFENLQERASRIYATRPEQQAFYLHEHLNVARRERDRRDAIRQAVCEALREYDNRVGLLSFCGMPAEVGKYEVIPVLSFKTDEYKLLPALTGDRGYRSFQDAVVDAFLAHACEELSKPNPSSAYEFLGKEDEKILRRAGRRFMFTVEHAGFHQGWELFENCNIISSLLYERSEGKGQMVVAKPSHPALKYAVRLRKPVPMNSSRWARKLLQMASDRVSILSDSREVYGLGRLSEDYDASREDAFVISFSGRDRWDLSHQNRVLMTTYHGIPSLPQRRLRSEEFVGNLRRVISAGSDEGARRIWAVVDSATKSGHGTMVVISEMAEAEAERLQNQATPIEPTELTDEAVRQISAIDGAILLDPEGRCHAMGVILDGVASLLGSPSRGARYNSAIRYIGEALAIG